MLGEYVNAMQTMTYDVAEARAYLRELNGLDPKDPLADPTDEEVLELINGWADEDFGPGDYILVDEDGIEL